MIYILYISDLELVPSELRKTYIGDIFWTFSYIYKVRDGTLDISDFWLIYIYYIWSYTDNHCATVFTDFFIFFYFLISDTAMVGVHHSLFESPVYIRTSRQLKRVEKTMFELMDHNVAFIILPDTHRCPSEDLFHIVRQNACKIRKVMFVSQNMTNEIHLLELVLKSAGYNGFSYTCPGFNI